jgi:hypothetical protein
LLIARGSEKRGKEYHDHFGSWLGFGLSVAAFGLAIFYLKYLLDEMNSYRNDIYKTFVQTNNF